MSACIKITTLNVEGHKHLERIKNFLLTEKPDVLCLQEVFKVDLPHLAACLGENTQVQFVPTLIVDRPNNFGFDPLGEYGSAIVSGLPLENLGSAYYFGQADTIPLINDRDSNTPNRAVLWADVRAGSDSLRVATTHFTWSPNGEVCAAQTQTLEVLLDIYQRQIKQGLLCGDFNAPRGGEIYQTLAKNFVDNVPQAVQTTLDQEYHRVPGLNYVVDYVFSTPEYNVAAVKLHSGLSDHQAISAELSLL